jgi:hypothetical protein
VLSRDRGSVLALIPAGFLVLLLLSALAVDSAVAYLGQQRLHDALAAAANDAAGAALNSGAFYSGHGLVLDPAQVGRVVCASIRAQSDAGLHQLQIGMAVSGLAVRVSGSATVDAVFGQAIPGFGRRSVRATADAVLAAAPSAGGSARFGPLTPLQC